MSSPIDTVLLISLDCVRREALGCSSVRFAGAPAPETPFIDSLARRGVYFDQAITQAPHTPASHASVLTGLHPYTHGIRAMVGQSLAPHTKPLAERLLAHGYSTAAYIGAHALAREYGLGRGFQVYDDVFEESQENWVLGSRRPCEESTRRAVAWLCSVRGPAFLFIHYFDCHDINHSPETTQPAWQIGQMARIDRQIGRLLEALECSGRLRRSLLILFADHGEAFGEHGEITHREYLYDTTLRIPLILCGGPFTGGNVVTSQVRAIDILPSVLEACDLPLDPPLEGESLSVLAVSPVNRPAYAETCHETAAPDWFNYRLSFAAFRRHGWKFILNRLTGACELYFVAADPGERLNLARVQPDLCRAWKEEIERLAVLPQAAQAAPSMRPAECELVTQRMKDLGYL
ncbi:MAG: sulfatase [Planctomycetota bacterium]